MTRTLSLLLIAAVSATAFAAASPVAMDTAGQIYLAAGLRQQVSASLAAMPEKLRQMFTAQTPDKLSAKQVGAVTDAARHAFRIDVFEPSALAAFAANLDPEAAAKALAFLSSPTGERMVRADIALAELDDATIDEIANGKLGAASTPARAALFKKLETVSLATESTATVYLTIARALAVGKAMGYGLDLQEAEQRVGNAAPATPPPELERSLEVPLERYIAYDYRDLSGADLRKMLGFLQSTAGQTYVKASIAALSAGFRSMGRRCGERIGESWRELAQNEAQGDVVAAPAAPAP
ncbi:MAG TPA: hypothetical protein VND80_02090 [Steroidobacteraceae bacterium]|nr:hypothetical protein [Steroidobacteraceae bacterium]